MVRHNIKKIKTFKRDYDYIFSSWNDSNAYDRLPEDTRYIESGIDDIDGGDTFAEYTSYFFDTYGDELFDDN